MRFEGSMMGRGTERRGPWGVRPRVGCTVKQVAPRRVPALRTHAVWGQEVSVGFGVWGGEGEEEGRGYLS